MAKLSRADTAHPDPRRRHATETILGEAHAGVDWSAAAIDDRLRFSIRGTPQILRQTLSV